MEQPLELPLFPLPGVVHFPRTDLKLHIFEPRYRQMISDLSDYRERERWIGMVLVKPGTRGEFFRTGTAGRLNSVERLEDGRSNIVIEGDFRFEVKELNLDRPYHQAVVQNLDDRPSHLDGHLLETHSHLVELAQKLAQEMGERFPLNSERLTDVSRGHPERLVNTLAAELDLPAIRKHDLLTQALDERARSTLSILRSRERVLVLLRPFRHLAGSPELN